MFSDLFKIPFYRFLFTPIKVREAARYSSQRPKNTPREFRNGPRPSGTVVACLGDSLTHGHVSYPWVQSLSQKYSSDEFHFINAGLNSHVAWQLNRRLTGIIECEPDIVVILIGTNDVMASFNPADGVNYKRQNKLPMIPSQEGFNQELRSILEKLRHIPKLAVCTLPPLGEIASSAINQLVISFNQDIRKIVEEEKRVLLSLDEALFPIIASRSKPPKRDYVAGPLNRFLPIMRSIADHRLRGLSWDESGARHGLVLLPDLIHLGDQGGKTLQELVDSFIQ